MKADIPLLLDKLGAKYCPHDTEYWYLGALWVPLCKGQSGVVRGARGMKGVS